MNKMEERKYSQLRKLGQELHIPVPEHFIELEVTDKNGKVLQTLKQRSHSWVRNAYNLLLSQMAAKNIDDAGVFGAGLLSIKDQGGGILDGAGGVDIARDTASFEQSGFGYRAAAGNDTHGIQVGSSANVESFEDYVLGTPIANGTGAGQLSYILSEVPTKSYNAGTKVFTITCVRYFNNNTAPPGDVNVNEVSLATQGRILATDYKWLMSRDKLGATVTIPATGQLKVTYTIQLTYPE